MHDSGVSTLGFETVPDQLWNPREVALALWVSPVFPSVGGVGRVGGQGLGGLYSMTHRPQHDYVSNTYS